MEDVSPLRRLAGDDGRRQFITGDDDRGQLILVTGLAIAVILVAFVLLLNTVIYTENLATRGADVGGRDAIEFENTARSDIAGVVVTENEADHETAAAATENVTEGVGRYATLLERGYFERATVAELSNLSTTNGTLLRQTNASRSFTNESGDADWQLATNASNDTVRRFRFSVARDDLHSTDTPSDGFAVVLDDGDETWTAYLYNRSTDGNITVTAKNASETITCTTDDATATVDLTTGTINGESCPGLSFAAGIDEPYDIAYENGSRASGTYSLTVNNVTGGVTVESGNFNATGDGSPYHAHAVYSVTVDLHYQTPRLTYAKTVRVAPGERDD